MVTARGVGWRAAACLLVLLSAGCATMPSNHRNWSPDQAVLSYADFNGDLARVHNIRNCTYLGPEDYVLDHYDKTFNLDRLSSAYFIVVPFRYVPSMSHTMLSFGFDDGEYLAVSVEVRREEGEKFNLLAGLMNRYEIMYVLGDERDLIKLRTNHRMDEVYVYRVNATPEKIRAVFVDVMQRANQLAVRPEFYHTLANNCTRNLARHVNRMNPNRVPMGLRVLLPANTDRLAYDLDLIETDLPFDATKRNANVSHLARLHGDSPDFSDKIRQ